MAEGRTADPSTALPGFPEELGGVGASCAFPLQKGAHAALSSAAWQEIRVRSGRDDTSVCNGKRLGEVKGEPQIPRLRSGRDDTSGGISGNSSSNRVVIPAGSWSGCLRGQVGGDCHDVGCRQL